jgi:hypothetical protein
MEMTVTSMVIALIFKKVAINPTAVDRIITAAQRARERKI